MKLSVISSNNKTSKKQKLSAYYNPDKDYTCINCDVDVVTLGITINVLQDLFDKATKNLDKDIVQEIKEVTRKAASASETY